MHANCKHRCGARFLKIGILVIAGVLVLGYVVMLLWNWLMPDLIDSFHTIGYLQAVGLIVLSRILFGGLRQHGCHGRWYRHRWHHLSPEEREKLQAAGCCGGKGGVSSGPAAEQKNDD
jgi:hypothetical protein